MGENWERNLRLYRLQYYCATLWAILEISALMAVLVLSRDEKDSSLNLRYLNVLYTCRYISQLPLMKLSIEARQDLQNHYHWTPPCGYQEFMNAFAYVVCILQFQHIHPNTMSQSCTHSLGSNFIFSQRSFSGP